MRWICKHPLLNIDHHQGFHDTSRLWPNLFSIHRSNPP